MDQNQKPNNREDYSEDYRDLNKALRKKNKIKRKKEKQILDSLIQEDEDIIEEYYDNFEKW